MRHLHALLALASCLLLIVVSCGGGGTDPNHDKTPPTVASTGPADDAVGVSINTDVSVTFSERVEAATFDTASFKVIGVETGSMLSTGATVTLEPSAPLAYLTTYTATVTTAITDTAGNHLASNYTWLFTTQQNPNLLPPAVTGTSPGNHVSNVSVITNISALFSKGMDASTLNDTTFVVDHGITGMIDYGGNLALFTPDGDLAYNTTYTVTISSLAADTFGINLADDYTWQFTTMADPYIPVTTVTWPADSAIIGDTLTVTASATHPIGVDSVVIFIDGSRRVNIAAAPYEYVWDASGLTLASKHRIVSKAYDADGRVGISDTVLVFYQWQEMQTDYDPIGGVPQDLERMLMRTNDTLLELRYEFLAQWNDPLNDLALDMAIYIDADQSSATGRLDFGGNELNEIGADYRILIGIHGDTAFARWTTSWQIVYDPNGFAYLNLPDSARVYEFGILWSDLGNPLAVDIVNINVCWQDTLSFVADWLPDSGDGYITIEHRDRYIGDGFTGSVTAVSPGSAVKSSVLANPFDKMR